MTNRLKGMTCHVRLRVQCWWLKWEVDRVARRIAQGVAWQAPAPNGARFRLYR